MSMWTRQPPHREVCLRVWPMILGLALGLALAVPLPSDASPSDPQTVEEVVGAVQGTYKGVNTLRAEFTQTAKNPLTGIEEKVRGRIALERPRKMRLEMGLPVKEAVVTDGNLQYLYSAESKQVIVQKDLGTAAGVTELIENLSNLGTMFDAVLAPPATPAKPFHVVTLKPKKPLGFKSLELTLTKQKYQIQELVVVDQADGVTRMNFTMVRTNVEIPAVEFTFKAPPGVTVVNM